MTIETFLTYVIIMAFLAWFYGPWQELCTDYARQIMFEQRDKLFDMAHSGEINFESDYYKRNRASLNAAIRFCHEMTIARVIYIVFCMKTGLISSNKIAKGKPVYYGSAELNSKVASINYISFRAMAATMMARSLFCVSIALLLSPIILIYFWWIGFFSSLVSISRNLTKIVETAAQIEFDYEEISGQSL